MKYRSGLIAALFVAIAGVSQAVAQTRIVTGKVTDSLTTEPVSSGQISVVGTTVATTIKDDGTFTMALPARDAVLSVRSIGYKRREVAVPAGVNSLEVALGRDYFQLEAIVVTGQATGVERRNLANAVATVSASDLTVVPLATVQQALSGRLAGASVQQTSGAPGGGFTVRLRGVTSLTGASTPLYVVDGVIVSDVGIPPGTNQITKAGGAEIASAQENNVNRVADLNPENIESIEVLKGASASAIYGSKASNGVILITTKRGRVGAPQFTLRQQLGFFEISHIYRTRPYNSLADATALWGPNAANYWGPGVFHDHMAELAGDRPLSYQTDGSVSGGTENTRYYASGLVKHDGGIVAGTYYDKQSMRINVDQNAGPRVSLGFNSDIMRSAAGRGLTGNDNNGTSLFYVLPFTPSFIDLRGQCGGTPTSKSTCPDGSKPVFPRNVFYNSNPFQTAALFRNDEIVWRVVPGGRITVAAVKTPQQELRFVANGGADFFIQKNVVFSPPELQFESADGLLGASGLASSYSLNSNLNANLVHVLKSLSDLFSATTSLGAQYETRDLDISRILAQNLIGGLQVVSSGTAVGISANHQKVKDQGFFAQEEVLIRERLLLTAGARWDRSSNNGDPTKWFFYPKAAASYRLSLIRGLLDEVKLRAAFGRAGNQALYGQKFTELGPENVAGVAGLFVDTRFGAADVRPEQQQEIETGVDGMLLGGRATIEATVYEKRITDLLLNRSLPAQMGFTSQVFNGGAMRTRGLELAISGVPISKARFQWRTRGTLYMTRCKVTELPVPAFGTSGVRIAKDSSCTQVTGRDTLPNGTSVATTYIGDATPKYKASLSNDVSFHALKLFFLLDRQTGGLVSDGELSQYDQGQTTWDCAVIEANGLSACVNRRAASLRTSRAYTQDASYLKLREVSLTLDLPASWVQRVWGSARYVRLGVAGRNLLTFSHFTGGEPEQGSFSTVEGTGSTSFKYPPSRSFWFNIDVGF